MEIHILTLFPAMFQGPLSESIVKRALERGLVSVHLHDIRTYTHDQHKTVDDYQYGGGPGMVMKPEPLFEAVEAVMGSLSTTVRASTPVVLLTPQGRVFNQAIARELAQKPALVLLCGHYEGVDERVREHLVTDEISIGDYVLTGGELAAMVIVDAVARLIPGVIGDQDSVAEDSFASGLLQYPLYTRPAFYRGWEVPPVLLSGDHGEVARWRRQQALLWTWRRRPDLLERAALTPEDLRFLRSQGYEPPSPSQ
ncbi:MAG: tRNA (guanosine(37)-N1)-methyltransferase TrmD [Dehalococcoidia bacterium]